ncbi:group 3 secretory phospholipase A2 precursor, partial [Silurus asotus]
MNGHYLFLVIVCLVSVLIDFSAAIHLGISARDSISCFWINSISNGQTHYMFLHQTTVGKERSFVLFDSIWSKENSLVDCIASSNSAVINSFLSKCWNASDKPDGHFNISMLVEPDGPCVAVGQSPELRKPVRRTRDLQSMDRKIIYRNNGESFQKLKRSKRAWLVPGTLWCGSGNKASNFSDLGLFEETDKCCREHDHCEQTIASFGFGYGVFNTNFFTLSHCDCDSKFRRCLHNVNDRMSNMVGYGYFNLLKMQCFEFSQRIECSERTWWGMCKHTQMSTYALLKEATDYNSTSEEVNDKLDLSIHHTVSFGDLTVTNDLVMPSDIVTKEANEKHSSVSVPERISVTVNTFQESGALGKTIDSTKTQTTDSQHKLDACESYKDLDTCSYQIPALREKFGLHNAEHATLYHCNCTARLARELAEEDEVDKVHFWLLDFVSQSCFFLPQDCTGSESCSTSFSSHDAPLIERWSKGAAVWRHLAAPRRKAKRLNSKRSKRKDSPVRLHRKCLRMHSKLHHPKTP